MISRVRSLMSARQFVHVQTEIFLFAQRIGTARRADVLDHRLVNGEAGIRVDHFVTRIDQRQHGEKDDRLAAGNYHDLVGGHLDATGTTDVFGDGLPQVGQSRRRTVVGPAAA